MPLRNGNIIARTISIQSICGADRASTRLKSAWNTEQPMPMHQLINPEIGEKSLLDRLPDLGSQKANWQQNAGVLREEMRRGLPIRDASTLSATY